LRALHDVCGFLQRPIVSALNLLVLVTVPCALLALSLILFGSTWLEKLIAPAAIDERAGDLATGIAAPVTESAAAGPGLEATVAAMAASDTGVDL
jgi:hypothetical protein